MPRGGMAAGLGFLQRARNQEKLRFGGSGPDGRHERPSAFKAKRRRGRTQKHSSTVKASCSLRTMFLPLWDRLNRSGRAASTWR